MLEGRKLVHHLLAERLAFGREIDAARLVFGIDRLHRGADGLRHHHHPRAAAKGIIVAFQVLVLGIVADVHDVDGEFPLPLRAAEDARRKRGEHLGKERQNGDLHSTATS